MPYIRRQNPEEQQPQAQTPTLPGRPANASVAAGGGTGAVAPRPQAQSRFVNLGSYLNQNRAAGDRMATNQVNQAEQGALGAVKQFQGVGQTFMGQSANRGNLSNYQPAAGQASPYESEYAAPAGPAVNQYKDVKYDGPNSIKETEGYGAAQNSITQANANIQGLGGGNLKNKYDAFLANQTGGQRYRDLRNKYSYLGGFVDKGVAESEKYANASKANLGEQVSQIDRDIAANEAKKAQAAAAAKAAQDKINATNSANQANNHAGYGDLQNTTVSQSDERLAQQHGLENEWIAAGRPPWDAFVKSRNGQ